MNLVGIEAVSEKMRKIANELCCARRCKCGGWQRALPIPERAEIAVYCGSCGVQMAPTIDVWP